jgi:hypothetical protein
VDNDGYENVYPLHLKTITIAGLPVEEIPCVEVYDLSGKVSVLLVVVGDLLGCTGRMVTLCVLNSHWNVAIPEVVFIGRFGCVLCPVVVYTRLLLLFALKAHVMFFTHVHRCSGRTPASDTPACAPGTPSTGTATSPSARTSSETSPWSAGTVFVNAHCYRIVVTDVRCWCVVSTYAVTSSADRRLKLLTCIVVNVGT